MEILQIFVAFSEYMNFIGQSYLKIMLEPIRTQNLGSLLVKLSQSNFNLRSPDCYSVRSYLITTVRYSVFAWIVGWTNLAEEPCPYVCSHFFTKIKQNTQFWEIPNWNCCPQPNTDLKKTWIDLFDPRTATELCSCPCLIQQFKNQN